FLKHFLSGGLKDTSRYLEKGIISGIMRVAKESIFSGLNNPGVFTLLSQSFADKFGFTEEEVEKLLSDFDLKKKHDDVKAFYNGYIFGDVTVYNPWSVLNFVANVGDGFKPYWVNTSDNLLINHLLSRGGKELRKEMEILLSGGAVEKRIEENIIFKDIRRKEELLWSFLLMGGYLKQEPMEKKERSENLFYRLSIPNVEVRVTYTQIVEEYFENRIANGKLQSMLKALTDGDIDVFEEIFTDYVVKSMSFFDTGNESEKVYHAFVMGLLLWLPGYRVKSNRESGYGRYDIMLIPGDTSKLGFIIEFKKVRKKETVKSALKAALKQIDDREYETELRDLGITNVKKLAIVFKGKDVTIKEGSQQ
ncbi:MAG: AAA family ATPase, partial [bacterium]|nr:AAA family ATPase [bacterium]